MKKNIGTFIKYFGIAYIVVIVLVFSWSLFTMVMYDGFAATAAGHNPFSLNGAMRGIFEVIIVLPGIGLFALGSKLEK